MVKAAILEAYIKGDKSYDSFYANDPLYASVCEEYRRRNDAYALISQICQLIKTVQKHRGYTLGILAGDDSYRERFTRLQVALKRRLEILTLFGEKTEGFVSSRDCENLVYCWKTISDNWQGDNVTESLELHSHFVEQLLSLMAQISADLGNSLLNDVSGEVSAEVEEYMGAFQFVSAKVEVLSFVGKFLPENIESIGKLRALSTHLASIDVSSEQEVRKLRFFVDSTRSQINVLRGIAMRLKEVVGEAFPHLQSIFTIEMNLSLLLSQIENGLLNDVSPMPVDGRSLFAKATEVIDTYWLVVNRGFELMHHWHEEEFDYWLAMS